jgi:hypothetical protein
MTDAASLDPHLAEIETLKRENHELQQTISHVKEEMTSRLVLSELKAEAVRAGIVDLDGLKLLDLSKTRMAEDGRVSGAVELIETLKLRKPWLFQATSSSTAMPVPLAQPAMSKRATEMTDAEYRAARAQLLGQHAR